MAWLRRSTVLWPILPSPFNSSCRKKPVLKSPSRLDRKRRPTALKAKTATLVFHSVEQVQGAPLGYRVVPPAHGAQLGGQGPPERHVRLLDVRRGAPYLAGLGPSYPVSQVDDLVARGVVLRGKRHFPGQVVLGVPVNLRAQGQVIAQVGAGLDGSAARAGSFSGMPMSTSSPCAPRICLMTSWSSR